MKRIIYVTLLFVLLLTTNRWVNWENGIELLLKQDVPAYVLITEASPGFPTKLIAYHHSQRLFWPYLIGILFKYTGIHYSIYFTLLVFIFCLLTIYAAHRFLQMYDLSDDLYLFSFSLLIFNPYFFRYYLIVPGMLQGVVFNFCVLLILISLIRREFFLLIFSLVLATLSRQTAILMIPSVAIWIYFGKGWSQFTAWNRILKVSLSITVVLLIYSITGKIAQTFSLPSNNIGHVMEIFFWINSEQLDIRLLIEFIFRSVLPVLIPLLVIVVFLLRIGFNKKIFSVEILSLLIASSLMILQSILSGPELGGKSATRLAAHGLIPIWVAMVFVIDGSGLKFKVHESIVLFIAIFFFSFHHIYSIIGPEGASEFAICYSISSIIIATIFYFNIRKSAPIDQVSE